MGDTAPRLVFGVENNVPLLGFPHGTGTFEDNKAIIQFRLAVQKQERKRIIALLESEDCPILISCTDQVVAFIKGENK